MAKRYKQLTQNAPITPIINESKPNTLKKVNIFCIFLLFFDSIELAEQSPNERKQKAPKNIIIANICIIFLTFYNNGL